MLVATLVVTAAAPASADEPLTVPGEIIVGFEEGVSEGTRNEVLAKVDAREDEEFEAIDSELVEVDAGDVNAAIEKLEDDPRVEYAEPNFLVFADNHPVSADSPNDPSFHQLWAMHNFGQTVNSVAGTADADIDALEAWSKSKGSSSAVVGIIDTGVDFSHPDLANAMWINPGEDCSGCRTNNVDDDGNGYIDDWRGWDFVNNDNNPFDDNGHGTHVAGTIGATGSNGVGVTGVNWTTRIMALKFLNGSGSGSTADAVEATLYASDPSTLAHVTNNSWGGGGFSQALSNAINTADDNGSLFVAAAGNDGTNNDTTPHYPSSYDVPNVISVASTTSTDQRSSFSNWGKVGVDLGAPGSNIYSTYPGNTYRYLNGTSMATPHVAGAAALVKARFPTATDLGIKALLFRTVDPNTSLSTSGSTPVATGGRLNVNGAVSCSSTPKVWVDAPRSNFVASMGEPLTVTVLGTNCGSPAGVTVSADANGTGISLTARGDGLYTGTYTPSAAGPLTITATAAVAGAPNDTAIVSGSVAANYRHEAAPFNWIDASGGTNTGIASDDTSASVNLPFSFSYYDQPFTSVKVSSNGYLVFGSSAATAYSNVAIPNTGSPNGLVAAFWDDLNPGAGGSVRYKTVGTAPNRKFVVEWMGVPHYGSTNPATFEVILEEGTNDIFLLYDDVVFGNAFDNGADATVGVENLAGTVGRQFSHNQSALADGMAIRFTMSADAGPTITTASLTDGTVAQAYSQTLQATGGTPPYTWSVTGALPDGLNLNASTGEISGTPTTPGTSTFGVEMSDDDSPAKSDTKSLSIKVGTAVEITTTSLADGTAGQSYNQTLAATGGETPYTFGLATGALPAGLTLNASTGVISGTPTTPGTYDLAAQVTDAASPARTDTQALTIVVAPAPLELTTTSLPDGTVGQSYNQTLAATGGTTPYDWSWSGDTAPGLTLNAATGVISGTPTAAGTHNFTAHVTDAGSQSDSQPLTITVAAQPAAPLTITTSSLPDGRRGQPYSATLQATGGTPSYNWSKISGTLPLGLTLNAATGEISGTPTKKQTRSFTVKVTDGSSPTQSATKALSIKIR
ncbi:MAG: S8 family serine peptidase [Actinomycetota bacterium]